MINWFKNNFICHICGRFEIIMLNRRCMRCNDLSAREYNIIMNIFERKKIKKK